MGHMKRHLVSLFFAGFALVGGVFLMDAAPAKAATYALSPSSGSFTVGSTITTYVVIHSAGQAINSGEGTVTFSSNVLQFQSVSKTGSIFTLWTNGPTASSTSITFGGGLASPGYTGASGRVIGITWKAIATGTATVSVSGGKILANDGVGTNVFTGSGTATYSIGPAATAAKKVTITSTSHQDGVWSSVRKAIMSWSSTPSVSGYYVALDQDASTTPSGNLVTSTSATYDALTDGIWYLHVLAASGSIPVAHFALFIDTTPPDNFTITVDSENKPDNRTPKITFASKDETSGIARYEASIDGGAPFAIASGDLMPRQRAGLHTLVITAYDTAGNKRESRVTYRIVGISAPLIISWSQHVNVFRPVRFHGRGASTDTIVVYLGGKEVDRFVVAEHQKESYGSEVTWTYEFKKPLFPGQYAFQFQRIDASGADSEFTRDYGVTVHASALILGNLATGYFWIVLILWTLVAILSMGHMYSYFRRRKEEEDDSPKNQP